MTTININTLTIAQLESTPLEGFYIQPMPAKDLLRTVVDFANNRTENYVVEILLFQIQTKHLMYASVAAKRENVFFHIPTSTCTIPTSLATTS